MDKIFGRTYRAQERVQPLWQRVVLTVLAAAFLILVGSWILAAGHTVWTWYRAVPAGRQQLVGRLIAFTVGMVYLSSRCAVWNRTLFHDPPMRDLALTPGSPARMLRVATRFTWFGAETLSVVMFVLLVAPWFWREWIAFFIDPAWSHLMPLCWPLAVLFAAGFCVLTRLMMDALAIGLNLLASATGVGGLGPRFPWFALLYGHLRLALLAAWLICCSTVIAAAFVPDGVQNGPARAWLAFGGSVLRAIEHPGGAVCLAFSYAPPVLGFDALVRLVNGPYEQATIACLGCVAWAGAGLAAIALCLRRGYSAEARLGLDGSAADAKPADAAEAPVRRFDPDGASGPIEAWLLARFGRMARAALRLVSGNYEAGSVDAHLRRSLYAFPVCIAGGWLTVRLLPEIADAIMQIFGNTLHGDGRIALSIIAAASWVAGVFVYRLSIWGTLVNATGAYMQNSAARANFGAPAQAPRSFRLVMPTAARGETKHPLTEIYAIGFSDAVLLPAFYTLFWSAFAVSLGFAEALLLGLPADVLVWVAAILIPVLPQTVFLVSLLNIAGYCRDYRRYWVITFFKTFAWAAVWMAVFSGLISLVSWMVEATIEGQRPWTGWLGSLNVTLVFDVALYMLCRLLYVRRRFDAERVEQRYG